MTASPPLSSSLLSRPLERPELPGFGVGRLLGVGASAEVWSATRLDDGRLCALKVIARQPDWLAAPPGVAASQSRELAVLRSLVHPHVVQLLDDLVLADGRTVLVLELVTGGSLARVVQARGHLAPGETVSLLTALGTTLADLHRLGVTHGDLAPGNVLFHLDGRPMLTDVGRAAITGVRTDEIGGTDGFVDPAVLAGAAPNRSSDVYAIGALGWFALTGAPPGPVHFRASLDTLAPDTPAALKVAIEGALDPHSDRRPSPAELATTVHAAAPPSPVRLAGDRDPADLLTHRIRGWAVSPAAVQEETRRRPAGRLGVVATMAAVTACLTATAWATTAADSAPGSPRTTATRPERVARPTWSTVVSRLTQARADAFNRPDVGPTFFDQPGSPAWRADDDALLVLHRAGLRYVGLRIAPERTEVLSQSARRASLRVTFSTSAYDVVDRSGVVVAHRSAVGATAARLLVELTPSGWRVTQSQPDG